MHILLTVITILSAIAIWAWRLRMARRGIKELSDMARTAANTPRKLAFRYRAQKGGIDLIEDPREAAAIMLMMMALAKGETLSPRQSDMIESEMRANFDFSEAEAEELAAHAAWVASSQLPGPAEMRRMSQMIVKSSQLGPKEIVDLDAMLIAVSEAEGLPSRSQLALLQIYRDMAGLKT